jgi:hypothetical protein
MSVRLLLIPHKRVMRAKMPKELACFRDPEIAGATCRLTLPFDAETAEKQVAEDHKIPTRCGIGFMPRTTFASGLFSSHFSRQRRIL